MKPYLNLSFTILMVICKCVPVVNAQTSFSIKDSSTHKWSTACNSILIGSSLGHMIWQGKSIITEQKNGVDNIYDVPSYPEKNVSMKGQSYRFVGMVPSGFAVYNLWYGPVFMDTVTNKTKFYTLETKLNGINFLPDPSSANDGVFIISDGDTLMATVVIPVTDNLTAYRKKMKGNPSLIGFFQIKEGKCTIKKVGGSWGENYEMGTMNSWLNLISISKSLSREVIYANAIANPVISMFDIYGKHLSDFGIPGAYANSAPPIPAFNRKKLLNTSNIQEYYSHTVYGPLIEDKKTNLGYRIYHPGLDLELVRSRTSSSSAIIQMMATRPSYIQMYDLSGHVPVLIEDNQLPLSGLSKLLHAENGVLTLQQSHSSEEYGSRLIEIAVSRSQQRP